MYIVHKFYLEVVSQDTINIRNKNNHNLKTLKIDPINISSSSSLLRLVIIPEIPQKVNNPYMYKNNSKLHLIVCREFEIQNICGGYFLKMFPMSFAF